MYRASYLPFGMKYGRFLIDDSFMAVLLWFCATMSAKCRAILHIEAINFMACYTPDAILFPKIVIHSENKWLMSIP